MKKSEIEKAVLPDCVKCKDFNKKIEGNLYCNECTDSDYEEDFND